jgi:hypothetical protein
MLLLSLHSFRNSGGVNTSSSVRSSKARGHKHILATRRHVFLIHCRRSKNFSEISLRFSNLTRFYCSMNVRKRKCPPLLQVMPLPWITPCVVFRTQTLTLTRCFFLRDFELVVTDFLTHNDGGCFEIHSVCVQVCHLTVSFHDATELATKLSRAWRHFYMQRPGFLTFATWQYADM